MCQCMIADCCWVNCCGVFCAGLAENMLFCSCWICKQPILETIKPGCCICGEMVGLGGNGFCTGYICCAPDWVKNYSKKLETENK